MMLPSAATLRRLRVQIAQATTLPELDRLPELERLRAELAHMAESVIALLEAAYGEAFTEQIA
jgi:hypothetical protein